MKNSLNNPLILSISGGLLLWAGWPTSPLVFLLFVGIVPFLLATDRLIEKETKGFKSFAILFLGLLVWNVFTTWWISIATSAGMLMAVIGNSALMSIPFMFYRLAVKVKAEKLALVTFVLTWLSYEYIHVNWSINWPWLTLGNGLAKYTDLVQWYEYTGVHGGTFWILLVNVLVFKAVKKFDAFKWRKMTTPLLVLIAPILVSYLILALSSQPTDGEKVPVVVVQPNFNTYTQKSRRGDDFIPYPEQIEILIQLSKKQIDKKTRYVVWPETAIDGSIRESDFKKTGAFQQLIKFLSSYPKLTLVSGMDSYDLCLDQENPPEGARFSDRIGYYETYNASLMMTKDSVSFYHKSKFVPGAEQVPFPWLAKPIGYLLGGVGFGSYSGQEEIIPFTGADGTKVAPSICYESIFGEFMTQFVDNGADFIFIGTNDDWWNDTEGHRQHLLYAKLRAIETRRAIARSANTGTSCFIDRYGNVKQATEYRTTQSLKADLMPGNRKTFYVKHGDYIGRGAAFLALFLVISLYVKRFSPQKN